MDLANRAALITGGKRIGGVVAEHLARGGADIALVYRSSRGEAEDAAAAVRGYGRKAVVMQADLRDLDAWNEPLEVDLRSAFLCTQAAVPYMRRLRGGRVVNISDWVAASGRPRYPRYLPYYVAKRAVMALTEALALELADDQILVNAVAPGPIVAPDGTSDREFRA